MEFNNLRLGTKGRQLFQMVWCAWWEETVPGRVVSKCFTTATGGQRVTTAGASSMQRWSADSWATGTTVLIQHYVGVLISICHVQMCSSPMGHHPTGI